MVVTHRGGACAREALKICAAGARSHRLPDALAVDTFHGDIADASDAVGAGDGCRHGRAHFGQVRPHDIRSASDCAVRVGAVDNVGAVWHRCDHGRLSGAGVIVGRRSRAARGCDGLTRGIICGLRTSAEHSDAEEEKGKAKHCARGRVHDEYDAVLDAGGLERRRG